MRQALLILALLLPAAAAEARPEACLTSLEGFPTPLHYDTEDAEMRQNRSYRERFLGGYGDITCPGYVTLRALTPGLTDRERSVFCLQFDRKAETYTGFSEGKRNAYLHCAQPSGSFCQRVNDSRDTAVAIAGQAGKAISGVNAVQNSTGAVVLTGTSNSITAALSSFGTSTAAALSAPAVLAAAAVTVVAVGGTVYVCSE